MSNNKDSVFLCEATRFKVSFIEEEDDQTGEVLDVSVKCFNNFMAELEGRWVALVPAENDMHMALEHVQQQRDELLVTLEACVDVLERIRTRYGIGTSAEIAGRAAIDSVKGGAASQTSAPATANYPHGSLGEEVDSEGGHHD